MKSSHKVIILLIAALGIASLWDVRLSIFALLLLVIGLAAMTRVPRGEARPLQFLLLFGLVCALGGMVRFVWEEALPGIAEARGRASGKRAVSLLREILFAQDAMRRYAFIDPDGDEVGSAGTLAELSGSSPARTSSEVLHSPPLSLRLAPRVITSSGPATEQDGHLLLVCVPARGGGFTSRHTDVIDDEKAERRWVAYAWPAAEGLGHTSAYSIDQHERILESQNRPPQPRTQDALRLVGPARAPSCDDAWNEATKGLWTPWEGKRPRPGLPGDHETSGD